MRFARITSGKIYFFCAAIGLASCSSGRDLNVTRHTLLTSTGHGETFMVILSKEQSADPLYAKWGAQLVAALEAQGFTAADKTEHARYAVMLDYRAPRTDHTPIPAEPAEDEGPGMGGAGMGGGGMGGMGSGGMGGGHHGGHGMGGGSPHGGTEPGELHLAIFDLTRPKQPDEEVFFAAVKAPTGEEQDPTLAGTMIKAALKDFPGKARDEFSEPLAGR